jgi:hypothetical protein
MKSATIKKASPITKTAQIGASVRSAACVDARGLTVNKAIANINATNHATGLVAIRAIRSDIFGARGFSQGHARAHTKKIAARINCSLIKRRCLQPAVVIPPRANATDNAAIK